MRRWHPILLGTFGAFALLPTASAFAIDAYVAWSTRAFLQHAVSVTDTLTLPGGRLRIEGTPVLYTGHDANRTFLWHARYEDEFVGSWQAYKNSTRAYAVGPLVVVIPGEDYYQNGVSRVFVRTRCGTWRETQLNFRDLADGVDPPELTAAVTSIGVDDLRTIASTLGPRERTQMSSTWIEGFSAERGEPRPPRRRRAPRAAAASWRGAILAEIVDRGQPIGTWRSEMWNPVAYRVGAAVIFLPDPSHTFGRTMRGQWKPLEVRDSAPAAAAEPASSSSIGMEPAARCRRASICDCRRTANSSR